MTKDLSRQADNFLAQISLGRASATTRFVFVSVILITGILAQIYGWSFFRPYAFLLTSPCLFFSAIIGGLYLGIFATLVLTVATLYFFTPPEFTFELLSISQSIPLILFMITGIAVSFFSQSLKNAAMQREELQRQLIEKTKLLEASQQRLDLAIESVELGIIDWLPQKQSAYVSPRALKLMNWPYDIPTISLNDWQERVHPEDWLLVKEGLARLQQQSAEPTWTASFRVQSANDSSIWVDCTARRFLGVAKEDLRILLVLLDITQRKLVEQRIRRALEGLPDAVLIANQLGVIIASNSQSEEIIGVRRNHFLGAEARHFIPNLKLVSDLATQPIPATYETALHDTLGQIIPVEVRSSVSDSEEGPISMHVIRDIRSRKCLELQLEAAKSKAEAASAAKTEFITNISHEIRTPLGVMLGYAQIISLQSTQTEIAEYADLIQKNGKVLLALINDILDLSKVESGRLDFEKKPVAIIGLVHEVVTHLQVKASAKQIDLSLEVESGLPPMINADGLRLRQILFNIIGNALKFTSHGGVKVKVRAGLNPDDETKAGSCLIIDVIDTGLGIAADHQQKIFTPFTQADCSIARHYGGTGLGLSLSRQLARGMGGDIRLESSIPGKGSHFVINLPWDPTMSPSVAESTRPSMTPERSDGPGRTIGTSLAGLKILLVEDFEDNQRLIKTFLRQEGAEVDLASNGAEGVEKAKANHYSVVFMDIQMPVLNGFEALNALKAIHYPRPVVALTANAMKGERERCIAAGFTDYCPKPVERKRIIELARIYGSPALPSADA